MRKNVYGRKLSRTTNQRRALYKSLVTSLIISGRIRTTWAKSKAVSPLVDQMITAVKNDSLAQRRSLLSLLSRPIVDKLISDIGPRFKNRQSGFTRIIKVGVRLADAAPMVIMEWVEADQGYVTPVSQVKDKVMVKKSTKKPVKTKTKTKKAVTVTKTQVKKKTKK